MRTYIIFISRITKCRKSLLFNKLTQTKNAIVSDHEGFTRDVRYGFCSFDDKSNVKSLILRDLFQKNNILTDSVTFFTRNAIFEADNIVYIFDANIGIQLYDYHYLEFLRKSNKNIIPVINKCEGKKLDFLITDYSELGFSEFLLYFCST